MVCIVPDSSHDLYRTQRSGLADEATAMQTCATSAPNMMPRPYRALLAAAILPLVPGAIACVSRVQQRDAPPSAISAAASPRSAAGGTTRSDSLWSPSLGVTKRVVVHLPPSYASESQRRYPVVYYLHGMWGSERDWADRARIGAVADSLVAAGMPELIIVLPDGDNGYYTNWATSNDVNECRARPPVDEPASTYCVPVPQYEDYIARDLVAWVDSTFRTRVDAAHRGIAGLSMGGYGAITLALRHPAIWSAAASHSGVLSVVQSHEVDGARSTRPGITELERQWGPRFWPLIVPVFGRDTSDWWAREPARLAEAAAARGAAPSIFIDVGTSDRLVLGGNRLFLSELRRLGIEAEYREWPGAHTWMYWRTHLPESLRWLAEKVSSG